jgi:hypothetical protein
MMIDCDDCRMQHTDACDDCVVSFVLNDLAGPLELDSDEAEALEILADAGLVAPLRLVPLERPGRGAATG